ncbi:MAG: type II toxin-antitoxin system HicA family toxin [bacterium]
MKLTDISSQRAVKSFQKAGFRVIRDRGPHVVLARDGDIITIPRHKRLNPFALKAIIEDSGLTEKEFKELL